jgi:uncharacterized protein (TIGR00730 family)
MTLPSHSADPIAAKPASLPKEPPLAYEDAPFLDSDDGRALRILAEYLEPLQRFRDARVCETIVFFGSARLTEDGPLGNYYRDARELARRVTAWSQGLAGDKHRYVVCTGGGAGIMEAANRGAKEAGGKSIGLNIRLPFEQAPNPYITESLVFNFHYFFMRKLWFAHLARALVVFPGGFGTLDEMTEILTLAQTGKLEHRIPIVLYGKAYWQEILDVDALLRHGMIAKDDLQLFSYADDPAAALALIQAGIRHVHDARMPEFAHSRTCR